LSDVIGGTDWVNTNYDLDDAAASFITNSGAPVSGAFKPTNYSTCQDPFAAPAPAGPYLSPGGVTGQTQCGTDTLTSAFAGTAPNGTWSLYVVDDTGGDLGAVSGGWAITITPTQGVCLSPAVPGAPTGATATAGNAKATVSFTAPASTGGSAITGYTAIASPAGGVDTNAGTLGLSHIVSGLINGTPYTFTVRATNAVGTGPASAPSNSVTPLAPLPFADDPLVVGVTAVKDVHVTELRTRINAQRVRFGLGNYSWTDPTLTPAGTVLVKAVHITEMRTALGQAYIAHSLTPPTYTDPGLAPGMTVKAIHITELRNAAITLEGS